MIWQKDEISGITIINIHLRGQDVFSIPLLHIIDCTGIQHCQVKSAIWKATGCFAEGAWQSSPLFHKQIPKLLKFVKIHSWCIRWGRVIRLKAHLNEVWWWQIADFYLEQYMQNVFRRVCRAWTHKTSQLKPSTETQQAGRNTLAHTQFKKIPFSLVYICDDFYRHAALASRCKETKEEVECTLPLHLNSGYPFTKTVCMRFSLSTTGKQKFLSAGIYMSSQSARNHRPDLEAEDSPSPLPSIPLEACNSPGLLSWAGKSGESSIL